MNLLLKMIVAHQKPSKHIKNVLQDRAIVNPSMAITSENRPLPPGEFGDVIFLGSKEQATPSKYIDVYGRDAFTHDLRNLMGRRMKPQEASDYLNSLRGNMVSPYQGLTGKITPEQLAQEAKMLVTDHRWSPEKKSVIEWPTTSPSGLEQLSRLYPRVFNTYSELADSKWALNNISDTYRSNMEALSELSQVLRTPEDVYRYVLQREGVATPTTDTWFADAALNRILAPENIFESKMTKPWNLEDIPAVLAPEKVHEKLKKAMPNSDVIKYDPNSMDYLKKIRELGDHLKFSAIGAVPLSAEELASQNPGFKGAPENLLLETINKKIRDNDLLNFMFGGTGKALDKMLQGNKLDSGDYVNAILDYL